MVQWMKTRAETASKSGSSSSTEPTHVRKATRELRRQQLIDATVAVLAHRGYAALTVADVAKEAGLSAGIVIFHFNSKAELLADALAALSAEYRAHWEQRLSKSGPRAADRLKAMLLGDFDTDVFTPQKLAAWIAFWGETQGKSTYDQICAANENDRRAALEALVREVEAEGGYGHDPFVTMRMLDSLTDGLWLGLGRQGSDMESRIFAADAREVVLSALATFFPRHYPKGG